MLSLTHYCLRTAASPQEHQHVTRLVSWEKIRSQAQRPNARLKLHNVLPLASTRLFLIAAFLFPAGSFKGANLMSH